MYYNPEVTIEERPTLKGKEIAITTRKAVLRMVIRHGLPRNSSVLFATGTQAELVRHLQFFLKNYPDVDEMKDQAHNVNEIKAMYKFGFRCKDQESVGLEETINLCRNDGGCLYWDR